MSYNLYFQCKNEQSLSREEFEDYFMSRYWYQVEQNRAWYFNKDTGVYFCFDYQAEKSTTNKVNEEKPHFIVSFNIQYNRPHIFGLEAEPEIKNFVEEFNLNIYDPQKKGMGEGPYSTEGFLCGWNEGNRLTITTRGLCNNGFKDIITLPAKDIERCWKWNFYRQELQSNLGDGIFVPKIMFGKAKNRIKSFIVWSAGISIVLPKIDLVVLLKDDTRLAKYDVVKKLCHSEEMYSAQGLSYKIHDFNTHSQKFLEFHRKQKRGEIPIIEVDQILDEELVVKAKEMRRFCRLK